MDAGEEKEEAAGASETDAVCVGEAVGEQLDVCEGVAVGEVEGV